jgi:hypothetical protein
MSCLIGRLFCEVRAQISTYTVKANSILKIFANIAEPKYDFKTDLASHDFLRKGARLENDKHAFEVAAGSCSVVIESNADATIEIFRQKFLPFRNLGTQSNVFCADIHLWFRNQRLRISVQQICRLMTSKHQLIGPDYCRPSPGRKMG